jgi:5-oxoprolinase (ATP-hydrolysing)
MRQHRQIPPRGLNGGGDGQVGKTLVRRLDGRFEELKGSDQTVLQAGEAVTVIPPTAGGFGKA